jgi:hypothetical protein
MIHRTALFAASLVAALTLAVGLVVAGFGPRANPADGGAAAPAAATADAPAGPNVQVDTVYVTAPATPQDVTVTQTVPAANHGDDGAGEHD